MNRQIALRLLALLALGITAFFVLFTTWASYDDEGYVLWTLIHQQQGHVLYKEIFSQYGPAFYVLDASLRTLLPFAYTTDGQRWQTLLFWIGSTLLLMRCLGFLAVRDDRPGDQRQRWSPGIFMFAAIGFFWHQERLALEPGHPQIWCNLLLCTSLLLLAARYASRSQASSAMPILQGVLAGTLMMIKPNAGVFLLAALPAGYVWTANRSIRWHAIVDIAYTASLLVLPWLLSWQQLGSLEAAILPLLISLSIVGLRIAIAIYIRPSTSDVRPGLVSLVAPWIRLSIGAAIAIAFFLLWSFDRGIDLSLLHRGLLSQHGSLLSFYFHPAIRSPLGWVACGLMTLAILGFAIRGLIRSKEGSANCAPWKWPTHHEWCLFFAIFGPLAVLINLLHGMFPLVHGLMPRGSSEMLLALSPAILVGWIALRSADLKSSDQAVADRRFKLLVAIAAIAAIQTLIAFPVPGTQVSLGSLPLILLMVDGFRIAWNALPFARRFLEPSILCLSISVPLLLLGQSYISRESLALPGAERLRLPSDLTAHLRDVVDRTRKADVDSLAFRWHNRPSWYLWTQLPPPHCQLPPSWTYLVSEVEQRDQLKRYQRFDRVLIVDEDYLPGVAPPQSPLHTAWQQSKVECNLEREFTFRIWIPRKDDHSPRDGSE